MPAGRIIELINYQSIPLFFEDINAGLGYFTGQINLGFHIISEDYKQHFYPGQ